MLRLSRSRIPRYQGRIRGSSRSGAGIVRGGDVRRDRSHIFGGSEGAIDELVPMRPHCHPNQLAHHEGRDHCTYEWRADSALRDLDEAALVVTLLAQGACR